MNYRVERLPDLPGGLPMIWRQNERGGMNIYLRDDLPPDLSAHFLCMAVGEMGGGRMSA